MPSHRQNQTHLLSTAAETLATSHEPLQQRLLHAFPPLLDLELWIDLPEELRARYEELVARASAKPAKGGEGDLAATLLNLSDEEAEDLAKDIVSLLRDLSRVKS